MFLLSFAVMYICFDKKQIRHIYYYLLLCITELVCIIIMYFPLIISNILDENYEKISVVTRVMGDTESFGLKLAQLILPITNHRIDFLAKIKEIYNTSFPLINENDMSTLGIIMAVFFLLSVLVPFFNLYKKNKIIEICGKMNLFIFCLATVGGIASIIGMVNHNIRCYNRYSFFIGVFSIIVFSVLFDKLWSQLASVWKNKKLYKGFKDNSFNFISINCIV